MQFVHFSPQQANTPASCSKQAARATPKGSLLLLCAAPVHENTSFCGQTVSKSTSVHEIVGSGGQDIKQPESEDCGIYRKSHLEISRWLWVEIVGVEPTTPCLQSRCSSQLSYTPVSFADANMVLFF